MACVQNNKGDVYHAIKKLCYQSRPCQSQVMTMTVLNNPKARLGAIAKKVVAQMAAKLWVIIATVSIKYEIKWTQSICLAFVPRAWMSVS